ncbi:MAG: DUF4968 domain-containing protein [Saprospiraceae bacterium]|nr:DUF4968 domain-containing protein [Saprospiraceae bacterium]
MCAKEKGALTQPKETAVANELTAGVERYPDVFFIHSPNKMTALEAKKRQFVFEAENGLKLWIKVYSPQIIRIRYAIDGFFEPEFPYALDPTFKPQKTKVEYKERKKTVEISTSVLKCVISIKDLQVDIQDAKTGTSICSDSAPFEARSTILKGVEWLKVHKSSSKTIRYYGLGDKSCSLDMRGQKLQNWNSDSFGYSKSSDPLYRSIPFYYALDDGQAYGIFLHNSNRSVFDFDSRRKGTCTIEIKGGQMDYFFIYGPQLDQVAAQYMEMTGKPELPPLWSLGFHQCRWSYFPEARVMKIAETFREKSIPCDAIYLDIDYMDGYRCFTWNKDHFPKPKKMIKKLRKKGFHTVVMIDPGIKVDEDYHVYSEGIEKDAFCRRTDGTLMTGPVWPPNCVWPDYTDPAVREWWGPLYEGLYVRDDVSGFWNDMNEPAVFKVNSLTFPDEVHHHFEGQGANHAKAHNIYGQQMARATYEGLKELKPEKRPFLVTRASFSGGQRFAAVWTGDNLADWEHLRLANLQCQRLSLSGFSFVGTDIGGFAGVPSGELLVRWLQLAIFHPFYRIHSMGNNVDGAAEAEADAVAEAERLNRLDQEPWAFGEETESLAKAAIELRYKLLPYIYTAFYQHVHDGLPLLRSLAFVDQSDPNTHKRENEFMFGDQLLISPVVKEKARSVSTYLPAGQWYDYFTGRSYSGKKRYSISTKLDRIPIFVRAGAVIPHFPVMQYTGEVPVKEITLHIYNGSGFGKCYLDAGEGYSYLKKDFKLCQYTTELAEDGSLQVNQEQSGKYKADCKVYKIHLYGFESTPTEVTVDGKTYPCKAADGFLTIKKVPFGFKHLSIPSAVQE